MIEQYDFHVYSLNGIFLFEYSSTEMPEPHQWLQKHANDTSLPPVVFQVVNVVHVIKHGHCDHIGVRVMELNKEHVYSVGTSNG